MKSPLRNASKSDILYAIIKVYHQHLFKFRIKGIDHQSGSKAEITAREEYERLKRVDDARYGRKLNKSRLAEREASWKKAAADKVVEEYGMTLEEITARAEAACKEAGVKGDCNEEAFYSLSATP